LLWFFWRWGLANYLPRLASNLDPPDPNLSSSCGVSHGLTGHSSEKNPSNSFIFLKEPKSEKTECPVSG
jgi:hypothetical protein